jgi:hypothetical protein
MPKRTTIHRYLSDPVSTAENTAVGQDPIPANRSFRITCFGAALPGNGRVELQKRVSAGPVVWKTIRAVVGPGTAHFENIAAIEGDGVDVALRIRRVNDDVGDQRIMSWIEGYKR